MKSVLISTLSVFTLFGCASTTDVTTTPQSAEMQQVSNVRQINWNPVELSSSFSFDINTDSQRLHSMDIVSPVAGFVFDNDGRSSKLSISSPVKNLSVFAPNLAIYDQNFKLLRKYKSAAFDYDRNDFIAGEVLEGEVVLSFGSDVSKVYALIYTTDQDVSDSTVLIHPAKAFAIAKRVDPPAIDDPVAAHSYSGLVEVSLEPVSSNEVERTTYYGEEAALSAVDIKETTTETKNSISATDETQTYYHNAIKTAVESGNIPKALSLLDEAKALNIKDAQSVFVKAVNSTNTQ
ncbi:MalM family protein [Vibrio tapetis subsp. quintayensis]|uniref:MalM family protein n=1 Tax=Vibrio tapetis TaxID=52443 RepID=UPI0025B56A96|nr:MalM family protein [Vibrio tapetis]MDN3682007.1 MalM family protein [Vibrio tapetis subsp. quintayensis]